MTEPFRHALHSDRADVPSLERAAARFLVLAGVPAKTAYAARVVVEELVTNSLRHGGTKDRPHEIDVEIRLEAESVVVSIEDDGREFDPASKRMDRTVPPLAERNAGGLGLVLVHALANQVRYLREGGRNRTEIWVSDTWGP